MYPGNVGAFYMNPFANGERNIASGAGNLYSHPFFSGPTPITIGRFDTFVVSLYAAGATIRAGLYTINNQQLPFFNPYNTANRNYATLLYDAGTMPLDDVTGLHTITPPVGIIIPANTFFLVAGVEQGGGGGTRTVAGSSTSGWSPMGMSNSSSGYIGTEGYGYIMQSVPAGPLPVNFVVSSPASTNIDDGIGIMRTS